MKVESELNHYLKMENCILRNWAKHVFNAPVLKVIIFQNQQLVSVDRKSRVMRVGVCVCAHPCECVSVCVLLVVSECVVHMCVCARTCREEKRGLLCLKAQKTPSRSCARFSGNGVSTWAACPYESPRTLHPFSLPRLPPQRPYAFLSLTKDARLRGDICRAHSQ